MESISSMQYIYIYSSNSRSNCFAFLRQYNCCLITSMRLQIIETVYVNLNAYGFPLSVVSLFLHNILEFSFMKKMKKMESYLFIVTQYNSTICSYYTVCSNTFSPLSQNLNCMGHHWFKAHCNGRECIRITGVCNV